MCLIFKKIFSKSEGVQPPLILVPKFRGGCDPPTPPTLAPLITDKLLMSPICSVIFSNHYALYRRTRLRLQLVASSRFNHVPITKY